MEFQTVNVERLEKIKNNHFYKQELETLEYPRVKKYYEHLIKNVELNKENPNNSYIMWVNNKVDIIDLTKPAKIKPAKRNFPDIDIDVPTSKREEIIEYVINKYGKDNVAHISTFSELQGKSILKDVLRAKQRCSYAEMNIITECIIDKAKVSDKLEEIRKQAEEQGEDIDASLIEWALDHEPKLSEWCRKDENGNLVGDYAKDFEQAMRLEWTKRQIGVHAAGLVVSDEPIQNFCPTTINKDGRLTVTWDKYDTEAVGGMKMDLLGLACHDDIMETIRIINEADYYVDGD